jgi:hypothetical protein
MTTPPPIADLPLHTRAGDDCPGRDAVPAERPGTRGRHSMSRSTLYWVWAIIGILLALILLWALLLLFGVA